MKDKSLKSKAVNIKGKDYVLVSDRIIFFNNQYENGSIQTKILSDINDKKVLIKAFVYPDISNKERVFIGHAQEVWGEGYINKTSAIENAETSAVGRALAMMGIGVIDSIASIDEVQKAENRSKLPESNDLYNEMMNLLNDRMIVIHSLKSKEEVTYNMILDYLNKIAPRKDGKDWERPPKNKFQIKKMIKVINNKGF
jgi:hypothetical protein